MIDQLLKDIEEAVRLKLYSVALIGLLTLPDICGAVEYGEDVAVGERYLKWLNEFGKMMWRNEKDKKWFSPEDVYELRCNVLHLGKVAKNNSDRRRIGISVPDENGLHVNWPDPKEEPGVVPYVMALPGFKIQMLATVHFWQEQRSGAI